MLTTAGTGNADPYAPPVAVPEPAPSALDARYAAERRAVARPRDTAQKAGGRARMRAFGAFLRPGSASLRNLTRIAKGRIADVGSR